MRNQDCATCRLEIAVKASFIELFPFGICLGFRFHIFRRFRRELLLKDVPESRRLGRPWLLTSAVSILAVSVARCRLTCACACAAPPARRRRRAPMMPARNIRLTNQIPVQSGSTRNCLTGALAQNLGQVFRGKPVSRPD